MKWYGIWIPKIQEWAFTESGDIFCLPSRVAAEATLAYINKGGDIGWVVMEFPDDEDADAARLLNTPTDFDVGDVKVEADRTKRNTAIVTGIDAATHMLTLDIGARDSNGDPIYFRDVPCVDGVNYEVGDIVPIIR